MALDSLFLSTACISVLEQPFKEGVDATCIFSKKWDESACPTRNPEWIFTEDP